MPDSALSEAIKEAYAVAPKAIIYDTLEIWHPSFTTPIYLVRDYEDLQAGIEEDAARNAGETVTFVRYAFDVLRPEVTSEGLPQLKITIDNVSRLIAASIEGALASTDYVTVTYREYLSTDLTGPQNDPPIEMQITDITADTFRIVSSCGFPNYFNKRFPTDEYDADTNPGLVM